MPKNVCITSLPAFAYCSFTINSRMSKWETKSGSELILTPDERASGVVQHTAKKKSLLGAVRVVNEGIVAGCPRPAEVTARIVMSVTTVPGARGEMV